MAALDDASLCCTCCERHPPSSRHRRLRHWVRRRVCRLLLGVDRMRGRRD